MFDMKKYKQEYRKTHKVEIAAYHREWQKRRPKQKRITDSKGSINPGSYYWLGKTGVSHPAYKNGNGKYDYRNRKKAFDLYGQFCSICSSQKHLVLHHIDHNPLNNDPKNWKVLCASCHRRTHSRYWGLSQDEIKRLKTILIRSHYKPRYPKPEGYLRSPEICSILGISRERLRQKKAAGQIEFIKIGSHLTFYKKPAI